MYAVPAALPFLRMGQTVYRTPHAPRGLAASSCGVLPVTEALADRELPMRHRNAERLMLALRGNARGGLETIHVQPGARPSYLRLPVVASLALRQRASGRNVARLGIAPSYPRALCDLPGFASRCGNAGETFSGARELAARLCTLPTHGRLSEGDLAELESWIHAACDS
jgi:dTDP-4-amino-4,6-dideoxygalactose transaminase